MTLGDNHGCWWERNITHSNNGKAVRLKRELPLNETSFLVVGTKAHCNLQKEFIIGVVKLQSEQIKPGSISLVGKQATFAPM
jgi:hypothetical protein